jgi:hypothetical protein
MLSLARADPRAIKPIGTDAPPINWAVFMKSASGGCPSGAEGICVPGTPGTKRAFNGGIAAMMNERMIAKDGGFMRDRRNSRARLTNFKDQ